MVCPRCFHDDVSSVNGTHYVCNDPSCVDESGNRTQFRQIIDDYVRFPSNQIFRSHEREEFYRMSYLKVNNSRGETSITA